MSINRFVIKNAHILTSNKEMSGSLLIENGLISEIQESSVKDFTASPSNAYRIWDVHNHYILPGFVDIHCHGGNGSSFMDITEEDFINVLNFHHCHGVTTIFPTSLSCCNEDLILFMQLYEDIKAKYGMCSNMLGGVHLEGPYLSINKAGAQDLRWCTAPDMGFIQHLVTSFPDIKRWTIAPEVDPNYSVAAYLQERNILVSAGHTDILFNEMMEACKHGYKHITHLYSGMNSLVYINGLRNAGAVEAALLNPDLSVELIADGIHLPYPFIELVYRLKGADRIAIVTDAMRGTGTRQSSSILGNRLTGTRVILEGGVAKLPDRTSLAGSITTQMAMFHRLNLNSTIPLLDLVKMFSTTPARIMGIDKTVGSIEVGKIANLIELDADFHLISVIQNGVFNVRDCVNVSGSMARENIEI